jgi:hypothetical protein
MAVTVTLTISPIAPAHGATVTATYTVTGNTGTGSTTGTLTGTATIGGVAIPVTGTVTLPATGPLPQTFAVPTCPGLTFKVGSAPNVFTAVVP